MFVVVLAMWFVLPATANATSGTMTVTHSTVLTEDHNGYIVIAADNVTLDCANHLVTGTGSGNVIQIQGQTGVTVETCSHGRQLRAFRHEHARSEHALEQHELLQLKHRDRPAQLPFGHRSSPTRRPITAAMGSTLNGSSQNQLKGNLSQGNGYAGFSLAFGSKGNLLATNQATANVGSGFDVGGSNDNTLSMNRSEGNDSRGYWLVESGGLVLLGNAAIGNGYSGIETHQSVNATLRGNSATGNCTVGTAGGGIYIGQGSTGTSLQGNQAAANLCNGFDVNGADNVTLSMNRAERNRQATPSRRAPACSCRATWRVEMSGASG